MDYVTWGIASNRSRVLMLTPYRHTIVPEYWYYCNIVRSVKTLFYATQVQVKC